MSYDTAWPADAVEFCPRQGSHDIFVCGTYKLEQRVDAANGAGSADESRPLRRGKCLVFQVTSVEDRACSLVQEVALPAVLDMKWCHRSPSSTALLGIADSQGNISLHQDVLCLSLDWSNRRYPTDHLGSLIVSLSDGSLALLVPSPHSGLVVSGTWHAHDYEPWIAAWNYWDTSVVYSGGDDLELKAWDIRQRRDRPLFVNKRFAAGVTAIQSHPHVEHLVAVGSYDSTVRLFDVRKPLSPVATADVGGGAWRVKWHPSPARKHDLLVACMHDGFKIVRLGNADEQGSPPCEVVRRFDQHRSLAYGVDWSFDQGGCGDGTLVASCSFYDHELRLWSG